MRFSMIVGVMVLASMLGCSSSKSDATVTQLALGDTHCPGGGVAVTAGGSTAYACSGSDGQTGVKGDPGIQGPQGEPGLQGPPGATGGGYYTSRLDLYCRATSAATSDPAGNGVTASCDAVADLPVFGDCHQEDTTSALLTGVAKTDNWTVFPVTTAAAVTCVWKNAGNGALYTNAQLPSAWAQICCIKHP